MAEEQGRPARRRKPKVPFEKLKSDIDARNPTVIGFTGRPLPKPKTPKQTYKFEKNRRQNMGRNVGGHAYSSDVTPYYVRTFREFMEIVESKSQEFKDRLENLKRRSAATDAEAQKTASQARSDFDRLSTSVEKYIKTVKTSKKANPHADED